MPAQESKLQIPYVKNIRVMHLRMGKLLRLG
jgi:hypothetical protein